MHPSVALLVFLANWLGTTMITGLSARRLVAAGVAAVWALMAGAAGAQDAVWLQIEARPTLQAAEERARLYSGRLENVAGFRLRSGWYAIAIGPLAAEIAGSELARLRNSGAVPRDSFISDGAGFSDQFWPVGGAGPIIVSPLAVPETGQAQEAALPRGETPTEARAAERRMTRAEREEVQRALKVLGFYTSGIDGAYGPGTRRAMATWQAAFGHEATGILTTTQRRSLVDGLRAAVDSLEMTRVTDSAAGIAIEIPEAEVSFQGYEAPFATYSGERVQLHLISQEGDQATLRGLYDVLQTLEIVPLEGPRQFGRTSFELTGRDAEVHSYTFARLADGAVKGFTLVWPTGDDMRRQLATERMKASFTALEDAVLPDTAGNRAVQRPDLVAGLQIRQPEVSVSGFFVDAGGSVVTVAGVVAACTRLTLGQDVEADVTAVDEALGLALLTPREPLAPLSIGRLSAEIPRLTSEIAVAGYSYGGLLGSPTMSFGTLEDLRGLEGEKNLTRLALTVEPGDAGGPVLDAGGGVVGMLLPREENGRALPPEVQFAADAEAIAAFLAEHGIDLASAGERPAMAPEDLALLGADMTVLVACWN